MSSDSEIDNISYQETESDSEKPISDYPDSDDSLIEEFNEINSPEEIMEYSKPKSYNKYNYSLEGDYIKREINRVTEILKYHLPEHKECDLQDFAWHIVNKFEKQIEYPEDLQEFLNSLVNILTPCTLGY